MISVSYFTVGGNYQDICKTLVINTSNTRADISVDIKEAS